MGNQVLSARKPAKQPDNTLKNIQKVSASKGHICIATSLGSYPPLGFRHILIQIVASGYLSKINSIDMLMNHIHGFKLVTMCLVCFRPALHSAVNSIECIVAFRDKQVFEKFLNGKYNAIKSACILPV